MYLSSLVSLFWLINAGRDKVNPESFEPTMLKSGCRGGVFIGVDKPKCRAKRLCFPEYVSSLDSACLEGMKRMVSCMQETSFRDRSLTLHVEMRRSMAFS